MKKSAKPDPLVERPNLDFSKGVRGKYSNRLPQGANVVILDPALATHFPDSEAVNRALHALLAINKQVESISAKPARRRKTAA